MPVGVKELATAGSLAALAGGWLWISGLLAYPVTDLAIVKSVSPVASGHPAIWIQEDQVPLPKENLAVELSSVTVPEGSAILDIEEEAVPAAAAVLQLASVEGVSLTDSKEELVSGKGNPVTKQGDDRIPDMEIYDYGHWEVAFRDNHILYVAVGAEASAIELDGVVYPFGYDQLKGVLGEPDFTAEDGVVYIRQGGALKLYLNPETGELLNAHYFHATGI